MCVFFLFGWAYLICWLCFTGDGLYWKAEENDIQMEKQKKELQEKEETIKVLKTQLLSMEKEKYKRRGSLTC